MALLPPYQAALHAYRSFGRSVALLFAETSKWKYGANAPATIAAFKAIKDLDGNTRTPIEKMPLDAPVRLSNGTRAGERKKGRSVD